MEHIRFLSLNCHGLSSDIFSYLRILFYWLSHANSHRLGDISNDSSAMEDRLVSGVFSGRPFGGTAILVRSVFANTHNSLLCENGVYMPWNDRYSRQSEEYKATLG